MPTSVIGKTLGGRRQQGFTLIELMVVLVIIGLASAAVVLAMPDPRGRVTDEAERLAARALAVRDDAVLQGRSTSLWVDANGYGVERRAHGRWEAAGERLLRPVAWASGTKVMLGQGGRVRATFDSVGTLTQPVTIELRRGPTRARIVIGGDGNVRVMP